MAVQPLWLQNLDYPARWDRLVFDQIWSEGVMSSTDFAVSQSASPGMKVDVTAGVAVVQGDDQAYQGKYLCRDEFASLNVTISAAPGSGQRNDLIVLKVNDPNAGGAAGDNALVQVVTGVASPTPVDPVVPASALVLARVRVPSGTGTITNALIDDLRVFARMRGATAPAGSIMQFAGSVAPAGWLLCDGTAYSQNTYSELFAAIGGTYNTSGGQLAPGTGMFRVPILTGRVVVGRDASQTEFDALGETGGAKTHTLTVSEMPSHGHTQNAHTHIQDSHNHTQNSHNHTQDGHNHTQNAHDHSAVTGTGGSHDHGYDDNSLLNGHQHGLPARQTNSTSHTHSGSNTVAAGMSGTDVTILSQTPYLYSNISPDIASSGSHDHSVSSQTATNQSTTATNQATTATNQATTATNQSTTATNQNNGGGAAHNNLQPYAVLNYIIKF